MEDEKKIQDSRDAVDEQEKRNRENRDDSQQNSVVEPAEGGGDVIIIK